MAIHGHLSLLLQSTLSLMSSKDFLYREPNAEPGRDAEVRSQVQAKLGSVAIRPRCVCKNISKMKFKRGFCFSFFLKKIIWTIIFCVPPHWT